MSARISDILAALLLLAFSAALYIPLGISLSEGKYYDDINLAFDFDPDRYVTIFTAPTKRWSEETFPPAVAIKHPFISLVGDACRLLTICGEAPKQTAVVIAIVHGIATNILFFLCLRVMQLARPEAFIASAIFAASAGQLFNALIVEAYVIAGTGIAAYLFISLWRQRGDHLGFVWTRSLLAVHLFGVTATNIVQAALAELLLLYSMGRRAQQVAGLLRVALVVLTVIFALTLLTKPGVVTAMIDDPVQALKSVLWTAPHEGEKSLTSVLKSFFIFVIAAPEFTTITIDGDKTMVDFRALHFSLSGWVFIVFWFFALFLGTYFLFQSERRRYAALLFLALVAFNVLFHAFFQYRASTFLYVAHVNIPVFLLSAAVLFPVAKLPWRYRCFALSGAALFLLVEINLNLSQASRLIAAFD